MRDLLPFIIVGLVSGSVYGLAGTGLVLTYKTSGIFNFAHGTIAALVAFAFYDLRQRNHLPWPLALLICLVVVAPLLGLLLERIGRVLADAPVAMKVVATVGLVVGLQQLIAIRYGDGTLPSKPFLPTGTFTVAGVQVGYDQTIVMAIALAGAAALTYLFTRTTLGRNMRAVVDNDDLLALSGSSPVTVRRTAWCIGTGFAGLSGILLAPAVGLDATVLTLLVVQAFGAAAIGTFTSIPLTYAGGLALGVVGGLSTKWVATAPVLNGTPASLPFVVLFIVLVAAPSRWLVNFSTERKAAASEPRWRSTRARIIAALVLIGLVARAPGLVGTRLPVYTTAVVYAIVLLSLGLLMRTSGQVSLAQLAFAAVGSSTFSHFVGGGLPWLAAVIVAALVAVPVGAMLAIPAIRRAGLYLALATFGFAVLLERMLYSRNFMFGAGASSLDAPRPSFARSDEAYFYVVVAFLVAVALLVTVVHRSRLGRLLRAMSDSPLALETYGTSLTVIKVAVFCIAAFIAGLGGALLGPITGSASSANFGALAGLQLIVVLVLVPGSEITAAVGAAIALLVLPSYITSATLNEYLPVVFGTSAVVVAMMHGGVRAPRALVSAAWRVRPRPERSPFNRRAELEVT